MLLLLGGWGEASGVAFDFSSNTLVTFETRHTAEMEDTKAVTFENDKKVTIE